MLLFRGRVRSIHQNRNSQRKYAINMCSGRIMPKMLLFAIPVMLTSILQLLFNAADIIVVGRFAGDNSLAAVGSNSSLIGLMTNLFVGLSIGTNVLVSRYFGSKDGEGISKAVSTSILVAVVSGVFLTLLGVIFARKILILMKTPPEVLGLATLYLVIYFFGMTPMMIYNFGSAVLRASGDTRRPLVYLSIAGMINVVLNLFFVIYLHLDVAGVAIATVISQCVSAALVLRCLSREEGPMRLTLSKARIDLESLAKIMRIGVPAGLQGVLFSFSNVVIQSSINSFGAIVMAGSSASDNIEMFVYFSMEAFYQATISFTSQNMGAGKIDRVYKVLKTGVICSVVAGVVFGVIVVTFSHQLLGIYTSSEAVIAVGEERIRIIILTYALCGLMEVMGGVMRGIGYSVLPTAVTLLGVCVFRVIWVTGLLSIPAFHSVITVYLSYPASWALTFGAHLACFLWVKKHVLSKYRRAAA
ncbi:MATE family efflux transporter [Cloacibacillus sp. An23]|uniref:MATE family efflux transporter n=1 Tax=Cloacibacillus sp. An23 TaxID=1965591 RepID=UPI000B396236|nr:MATE family efflux transporter [Cloacibacillus sp. An23]OUO94646.1 MATE family efflux transporter [Cloacibacillus sp. An23]